MRFLGLTRAGTLAALVGVVPLLSTASVSAQSAADKATARQAATEGITRFNEGKYEEALDRLRRAQALYDAPVHLLYIARAQVKLNQLVEAAENYRLLVRTQLPANAPPAFENAVEDGKKELAELEPRIPTLQITIEPKEVAGLELKIDDKPVAAAVIGIDRPINPGAHRVTVQAAGYQPAEQEIDVAEGSHESVEITLAPVAEEQPPAPVAPPPAEKETERKALFSNVGFMLGARLGVSIPAGVLQTEPGGSTDVQASDFFGTGGGIEIHGGLRFAKYFTGVLLAEVHALSGGNNVPAPPSVAFENSGNATGFGLGIIGGTERNKLGFFGEVDLLLHHRFALSSKAARGNCSADWSWTAPALRVGGGGVIPIGKSIHLTPFAMGTFSQFNTRSFDIADACGTTGNLPGAGDLDLGKNEQKAAHALFFLGVGGDFVFGSDGQTD